MTTPLALPESPKILCFLPHESVEDGLARLPYLRALRHVPREWVDRCHVPHLSYRLCAFADQIYHSPDNEKGPRNANSAGPSA